MNFEGLRREAVPEIVEFWNRNLSETFPMTEELFIQNSIQDLNVNSDATQVVKDGEKVVGLIVVKHFQEDVDIAIRRDIGWIQVLLVDQAYRGRGLGSRLLNDSLEVLKSRKIEQVKLGRDVWHYFPGVPRGDHEMKNWFMKKGFIAGEYVDTDLTRTIHPDEPYDSLTNQQANFKFINLAQKDELQSFMRQHFPGRWEYEVYKYFELGGTGDDWIVLLIDGKIEGFCRVNDRHTPLIGCNVNWSQLFNGYVGGIGPLGINSELRGRGLGLDIVKVAVNELRRRGNHHLIIDWTGLIDFYKKAGFSPFKQYISYSKGLV